jgi:chromosome segregation ATPase
VSLFRNKIWQLEVDEKDAEIAGLKGEIKMAHEVVRNREAEIERLKAEYQEALTVIAIQDKMVRALDEDCTKFKSIITDLGDALDNENRHSVEEDRGTIYTHLRQKAREAVK